MFISFANLIENHNSVYSVYYYNTVYNCIIIYRHDGTVRELNACLKTRKKRLEGHEGKTKLPLAIRRWTYIGRSDSAKLLFFVFIDVIRFFFSKDILCYVLFPALSLSLYHGNCSEILYNETEKIVVNTLLRAISRFLRSLHSPPGLGPSEGLARHDAHLPRAKSQ